MILKQIKFMEKTKCLICGKDTELKTTEQVGYQEPDKFKIYHCTYCNTSFSIPRIKNTDKIYNLIYKNTGKNVSAYDRYFRYSNEILTKKNPLLWLTNQEPAYWGAHEAISNILKDFPNARLLEVGSGLGYFTYALYKSGYNITGLDISQEAVDKANKKYGNYYIYADATTYNQKVEKYDIIILTEVIEHLNEPIEFLQNLLSLLKDNGHIVLTTPNKSFFPKDSIWITDLPPIHSWWFSEESFIEIANQLKCNISFIDYSPYYKTHMKEIFDTKFSQVLASKAVFDANGNLLEQDTSDKRYYGILPLWIKKNKLYRYISREFYPIMFRKRFIVSNKERTSCLCTILNKK